MQKFIPSLFIIFICSFSVAQEPSAEHKTLQTLAGRWTLQGLEDRFLEICEVYPGGYFLVCNAEFKLKSGALSKSVSILGYSVEDGHSTYYHYGSRGESQTLTGRIDLSGNFHFEGVDIIDGKPANLRISMTKGEGQNYNFKEETSIDGGPWETTAELVYIRLE